MDIDTLIAGVIDLNENKEKVYLWTRQNEKSLDEIKKTGRYIVKKRYIEEQFGDVSEHYLNAYKWLVEASSKIVPRPEGAEYPIWCSISDKNRLRPIEGTICYKLIVDKSKIVYFYGTKWDYVLNNIYIPKDSEDEKNYKEEMKKKGFNDAYSYINSKYEHFYPVERKKIIDSWDRIFQIDDWSIFKVQANIWEIREDMIVDLEEYEEK